MNLSRMLMSFAFSKCLLNSLIMTGERVVSFDNVERRHDGGVVLVQYNVASP
jgi:hypothetical protein